MHETVTREGGARVRSACLRPCKSEFLKTRSFPAMAFTAVAIVAFSAAASAYLTYMVWSRPEGAAGLAPSSAYQIALPMEQVGFALMGALVVYMDESSGLRSTFLAVPRRGEVLAAKVAASAVWSALTAGLAIGAAYAARTAALAFVGADPAAPAVGYVRMGGLVLWWVVLSVLVTCLSVLARRSMPVLVPSLAMMLMLSSVLRGIWPAAAWLPDQLALCLYQPPASGDAWLPPALAGLGAWMSASLADARLSIARWRL